MASNTVLKQRREMIEGTNKLLGISKQCSLLGIHRSGLYYRPVAEREEDLQLMLEIDKIYLKYPFMGSRRVVDQLTKLGFQVNRKRVQRLRRLMRLETFYPKPNTSKADPAKYKYPYLLKNLKIEKINQAWAVDITYVPMKTGFMYLVAIIDLYSRYVVNWSIGNTMDAQWVANCLSEAFDKHGVPQIINSDQGSQFTSEVYLDLLKEKGVAISMDGKGRAVDNIFIERLWRSVKWEYVYLNPEIDGVALFKGLTQWFKFYNHERNHQGIDMEIPAERFNLVA